MPDPFFVFLQILVGVGDILGSRTGNVTRNFPQAGAYAAYDADQNRIQDGSHYDNDSPARGRDEDGGGT